MEARVAEPETEGVLVESPDEHSSSESTGRTEHETDTISAAASGAAIGAVAGFAILPIAGGVIGSIAGGLVGLGYGLVSHARQHVDEEKTREAA
jgi:uncharacterized membrane protein